jgi:hypothetical protein
MHDVAPFFALTLVSHCNLEPETLVSRDSLRSVYVDAQVL